MARLIGLDPADIRWVDTLFAEPIQLFAEGKIDAYVAYSRFLQEFRARNMGHVIASLLSDHPWSQYCCCLLGTRTEFAHKYPVATKRFLRAILNGADLCVSEPARVAQLLPNNVELTYAYDTAKRLTSIANSANEKIEFTRDKAGNVIAADTKDSSGTIVAQVRRTYDELSRVLKNIGAADQETQFAYDRVGNNTQITDPRSKVYGNTFDELNRLVLETDPDLQQTNTNFTGRDNIESVADARTNATEYVRNGWGDIIRETSPDRGVPDYVYDARGLMTQRTDARGQVTNFDYDGSGRIISRSFPDAPFRDDHLELRFDR
jgi:YD repeat-containing protein